MPDEQQELKFLISISGTLEARVAIHMAEAAGLRATIKANRRRIEELQAKLEAKARERVCA